MYYFYSVLCNRIRHNCCCCCCFWLIIQIMYSPANRVFPFSEAKVVHPEHVHTIYPSTAWNKHFLHTMYFRCYNNYMIEENDNSKEIFYFLSPNVLLLFVFKIASWNVFFFLRNSVLNPPFLIVYLYYIIKVQNPEKLSQTRIYELLWISNDEFKLLN